MAGRIKGITIEINGDTKGLDKALSSVNSSANKTQSELRDVNKLLKLDPGNTELVAQKQKLLSQAITQTGDKLKTLKDAQAQVDSQFAKGDIGEEQYRAFQREIASTEATLKGYKSQLSTAENSQQELSQSTKRLETFFKATGTEIDDFKSVIGTRLVNAIKNGTASSESMDKALQMIAKEAGIASSDMSKLTQSLDKVDSGKSGMNELKSSIGDLSTEAKNADGVFGSFKEKLSLGAVASVGANVVSSITGGLSDLVSEGVEASDAMDKFDSTMKFAGFGKDQIDAAKKSVQEYANDTVYDLGDVSNTTAQLAANGIQDYTGLTEAAGNLNAVAGGNSDTFKSVAMMLTQTAGAGKLTTENWNQLADAIPGASGKLQEAMKKNGAYTGNFRDAMANGQITSDEFNQSLKQLGMTDAAKKAATATTTFEGAIGNLQANVVTGIQDVIDSIGKANFTDMINTISNGVVGAFKVLITTLQAVTKAIDFVSKLTFLQNAWKQIGSFISSTAIPIFNQLKDSIGNSMGSASSVMSSAGAKINQVIQSIVKFISANWGTISTVIGFVMDAVSAIISQGVQIWQQAIVPIISNIVKFISENWGDISNIIMTVLATVGGIIVAAMFVWQQAIFPAILSIAKTVSLVFGNILNAISGILGIISGVINLFMALITGNWKGAWDAVLQIMDASWKLVANVVMAGINIVVGVMQAGWALIKNAVTAVWNVIVAILSEVWNVIKAIFTSVLGFITAFIQAEVTGWQIIIIAVMNIIMAVISGIWNGIKAVISGVVNAISSVISSVWNGIVSITSSTFNAISSVADSVWNGISSVISGVVNGISSTISGVWNGIVSITSSVWNGIKNAITGPMNTARDVISGIINAIKGFFSFSISWPHIPMPSFSITPAGWEIGDLLKGKIPSLGISWHAAGGIFTKPTLFSSNGGMHGVGEAGPEAVMPLNKKTLAGIGKGIADTIGNSGNTFLINIYPTNDMSQSGINQMANQMVEAIKNDLLLKKNVSNMVGTTLARGTN